MPAWLCVHLGAVMALFVTLPYGKMVHAVFRTAALAGALLRALSDHDDINRGNSQAKSEAFTSLTTDQFVADVSLYERNLLGRGLQLRLALTWATRRQDIDFSFTQPYFLGRGVAAGFDLFSRTSDLQRTSGYELTSRGFSLRAGVPLTEALSSNFRFRWEYRPGSEMFVVYTDERDTSLSGFPFLRNRAFVVKVNRLLRF